MLVDLLVFVLACIRAVGSVWVSLRNGLCLRLVACLFWCFVWVDCCGCWF